MIGGVVTIQDKLKLDVGKDLKVESLQDTSKSNSYTPGVSASGDGGGVTQTSATT